MDKYSYSKLSVAENCLHRFNEQYNKGRWEAKDTDRSALVMGDAFHNTLELMMKDFAEGSLNEMIASLMETEVSNAVPKVYSDTVKKMALHYLSVYYNAAKRSRDKHDPEYIKRYEWMVRNALTDMTWWICPGINVMDDLMVEQKLSVVIANPDGEDFEANGKLDIIDSSYCSYDYKTASALYDPDKDCQILSGKGFQLGTQALLIAEHFKVIPEKTGFIIFPKKPELKIQTITLDGITAVDIENVKKRMCWMVNTINWYKKTNRWQKLGLQGTKPDCMFCQFKQECGR